MRFWSTPFFLLTAALAGCHVRAAVAQEGAEHRITQDHLYTTNHRTEKIILIPLDSRPAAGQFAQMIGNIASVDVIQPPYQTLGRFTSAGAPDSILSWLDKQDLSKVDAVIVSTDMIAYGGLIASRVPDSGYDSAMKRIRTLQAIRFKNPRVRFYGFSAIMRLAPTDSRNSTGWRRNLALYEAAKEHFQRTGADTLYPGVAALRAKVTEKEIQDYEWTRARDHRIQEELIHLTKLGLFDYFVLGQDDAQPFGPHVPENEHLRQIVDHLGIAGKVYFCEGIDQDSNVLLSRALLKGAEWTPHVHIVYSDPDGKNKVASFESKTIEQSLRDQIFASGARVSTDEQCDYTVYLNTPNRDEPAFQQFLDNLNNEIDQGAPICVADIDLAKDGTADPELFSSLVQNSRMVKLLSYAGWNTAGNTMGTAVPAANVYLYARKANKDPLQRELARREFLLHRFVNDYDYHKYTRPMAYHLIDSIHSANREEAYGEDWNTLNNFVRQDLNAHLQDTFKEEFLGKRFNAGNKEYEVASLDDVKIFLPWPRAYEVRLEFKMQAREVPPIAQVMNQRTP